LSTPLAITQGSLGPLDEETSNPYENESPSEFLREHILATLAEKTLPDYYKILDELIEDADGQLNDEETEDLDDIKDLVEDLDGKIKDLVEHLVKDDQDPVEDDPNLVEDLDDQDLVEDLDYDIKDLVEHLVKDDQDIGGEMEESGEGDDQFDGTDDQLEDRNDQFEDTDDQFEDTDDKFEDTDDQFEDADGQFEDTDNQLEDLKDQLEDTNDQFEATINQLKDLWGLNYYQNDEDAASKKVDDQFEGTDDQFENTEDQFEDADDQLEQTDDQFEDTYDQLEDTDEQFEDLSGLKDHEKDEDAVSKNRFKRSPFFNPLNFLRKHLKGRFHPQLRPNLPYIFISQGRPKITSTGAIQHHTGVDPRAIVYDRYGVGARLPRPRFKK